MHSYLNAFSIKFVILALFIDRIWIAQPQGLPGAIEYGQTRSELDRLLTAEAKRIYQSAKAASEAGDFDRALGQFKTLRGIADVMGGGAANRFILQETAEIYRIQLRFDEALSDLQDALRACDLPPDGREAKAWILSRMGLVLSDQGHPLEAQTRHQEALQIARDLKNVSLQVISMNGIGVAFLYLGEHSAALEQFQKALALGGDNLDTDISATLRSNIAYIYGLQGKYAEALLVFEQAEHGLASASRANEPLRGRILNNKGMIYFLQGMPIIADASLQEALKIAGQTHDAELTLLARNNLAVFFRMQGNVSEATRQFAEVEQASTNRGYLRILAQVLSSAGENYQILGRYSMSLRCLERAGSIFEQLSDPVGQAGVLNNLGTLFISLRRPDIANSYFERALTALTTGQNSVLVVTVLNNIGVTDLEIARSQQQRGLVEASTASIDKARVVLERARNVAESMPYPGGAANVIGNLAEIDLMKNDAKAALLLLGRARELAREAHDLHNEGRVLNDFANAYGMLRQFPAAEAKLQEGIAMMQRVGDRRAEVVMLTNLGALYEAWRKPKQALSIYGQAMTALEKARGLSGGEGFKAGLAEEDADLYEVTADLLMRTGQYEDAFNVTERARARTLLDLAANSEGKVTGDANARLFEKREAVMLEVNKLEQQLLDNTNGGEQGAGIKDLEQRLADARQRYDDLSLRLKNAVPESIDASLNALPARLADVQASLPEDTAVLSYFVAGKRIYGFAVRHAGFQAFTVAMSAAEVMRHVNELSGDYNTAVEASRSLYKVLIQPVRTISDAPIIAVVPHRALHYLPFAALMDGEKSLIDGHTVFDEPSASMFVWARKSRSNTGRGLFAVAENSPLGQRRLENAEQEAKEAYEGLYGTSPQVIPNTETAFRMEAPHFGLIHIAAHTELNYENPLFSRILLRKDDWSDGALEVHEILELDLRSVGLVVLSACDGQWGPDSRGDEVLALNRAFLYAGAASVIASPGRVNDKAARLFMNSFYSYLGKHYSKAEALRSAQFKVREKYPLPSDWAAFVLTGDPGMLGDSNAERQPTGMRITGIARGTQWPYLTVQTADGSCIRVRLTPDTRIIKSNRQIGTAGSVASSQNLRVVGHLAVYATTDQETAFYALQLELPEDTDSDITPSIGCTPSVPAATVASDVKDLSPSSVKSRLPKPQQTTDEDTNRSRTADTPGGPIVLLSIRSDSSGGSASSARAEDAIISRAREATRQLVEDLPNFRCRQVTTRHLSKDGRLWTVQDTITAEVAYIPGNDKHPWQETYEEIEHGGKPWKGEMMGLDGFTSTGEFGTTLRNLFSERLGAVFSFVEEAQLSGREVVVYNYQVTGANSDWHLKSGSHQAEPAYRGTVWIDKATAWVWRIRHYADEELPADFPWRSSATDVVFDYIKIKDLGQFVLPRISANTMCERVGSECRWNLIQFENYQRFVAEVTITFEDSSKERQPNSASNPTSESDPTSGQRHSGALIWSGDLDSLQILTIDARQTKSGKLSGQPFPGDPISIKVNPSLEIMDPPSKQNGWQRLVIRNGTRKKIHDVQINWRRSNE